MTESTPDALDWRDRVIARGALGASSLPSWAERSYQILHRQVVDDAYPCYFGVHAERRGEMFYAFMPAGQERELIEIMAKFAELAAQPAYEKNNIAIFFEPDPVPLSHAAYHDRFWHTLQTLHDADTHPHAAEQADPSDPAWEFCYQGLEMFVVCACPSFKKRHSRNLGPGMVLLFQPRSVFVDKITNKAIGRRARQQVRKRLDAWDELGAHPDLGFYGDPGNLEWKQYFLPDDNQPNTGVCPFSSRRSRDAGEIAGERAPVSDGTFPLTATQEALWFSWCIDPESAAYHVSHAIDLEGALNVEALRRALDLLVARHEILRAAFIDMGGEARQCVEDDAARSIDWVQHDLRESVRPMDVVYALLRERGNRSFDLGGDGLVRVTLLCLADDRHIVQLCAHQIMLDAGSLDQLRREWLESYAALRDGREPNLPPQSMQFGDYATQSRARLDSLTLEPQLGYWRKQLGDTTHVLDLPLDRSRPASRRTTAGRVTRVLDAELNAALSQLAAAHDIAPFVIMLGAFALLLQRYSGQGDVRMAVPLSQRRVPIDDLLIGQFTNIAVIRLQVSSAEPFSELLDQGNRRLTEARLQGDLPFARLVDSLRVARSLASTPLCQVMFNQAPTFAPEFHEGIRVRRFDDGVGRACYDLCMNVANDCERTELFLDYSSALFDRGTIEQVLAHYLDLLSQLALPGATSEAIESLQLSRGSVRAAAAA